jgi:hypothetical protein
MIYKSRIRKLENEIDIIIKNYEKKNRPVYSITAFIENGIIYYINDDDKEERKFDDYEKLKKHFNLKDNGFYIISKITRTREDIEIYRKDDEKKKKIL